MQCTQISISDHLLLHVFVKPSILYQRGPKSKKRVGQKKLNILKSLENVLRDFIHSGKGPNPCLIEKDHLGFQEKDFSGFRKIPITLCYTFDGVPIFCSQWTSKNTINSIKRIQVDQNVYHTDEDILYQFRKYTIKSIAESFLNFSKI